MTGPLVNARHEKFAQELAKGLTADAAYAAAGFRANRGNATTLKAKQSVRDRVEFLQSEAAKEAIITAADIARQLDEDRAFARDMEAPAAMVSATMGKAKVLGLVVDKAQIDTSMRITVTSEDAGL